MNTFDFDTIAPGQAFSLQPDDVVLFHGGPARLASASFDPSSGAVTVTFNTHTVVFDSSVVDVSVNAGLRFDDGSILVVGDARDEALWGTARSDAIFGGAGDDTLLGREGDNLLQGNQGRDVLISLSGADTLFGGQGDDYLQAGLSDGTPERGNFAQGNLGDDTILGGSGLDTLLGGKGDDSIDGRDGGGFLNGNLGNDYLSSRGVGASLVGEDGNDTLVGRGFGEIMSGGPGADLFVVVNRFLDETPAPQAFITDLDPLDHILLPGVRANPNYQEIIAADFRGAADAANAILRTGGDIVVAQVGGDLYAFANMANGPDADLAIKIIGRTLDDVGPGTFV